MAKRITRKVSRHPNRKRNKPLRKNTRKRFMWRIIVGFPYLLNKKKQKSPDARTMKAIYYDKKKENVIAERARLRKAASQEVKKFSGQNRNIWIQTKTSHPLYRRINIQVSRVEYDKRFIGITEYLDD